MPTERTLDPAAADIAAGLGLPVSATEWLAELSAARPVGPTRLPADGPARALLTRMRVPEHDIAEALAARPDRDPRLRWLLDRCRALLAERLGSLDPLAPWPDLPSGLGAVGRFFYLWLFVAAAPDLLAYHAAHGVPEPVSNDTLADVGAKTALHRRTHGVGGLDKQDWFTLHFRGLLYALGRLQFNMARLEAGLPGWPAGTGYLGVHIPEAGPMAPADCDSSFAAAPGFFARHFGIRYRVAVCTSWLLDEQLTEYLPAGSNIVRFQQRFHRTDARWDGDDTIIEFVFRRTDPDLAELPQDTTLQRAVVSHLRSGRHWQVRSGWLDL